MMYDKRALYDRIHHKIFEFGLDHDCPTDVFAMIKREGIELHRFAFESSAIGAVLYKDTVSAILLNSNKPPFDRRFDAAHELIHYWFHSEQTSFSLSDPASRDKEKEWQANEGAAELLLPYKDFIPRFIKIARYVEENYEPLENIYAELSRHYKVNPVVVDYRIRNLEREILQHFSGVPLEDVSITRSPIRYNKDKQPVVYRSLISKLNMGE